MNTRATFDPTNPDYFPDPAGPPADFFDILADWLPDNLAEERPVMTLATVNVHGVPETRTVLLSSYDRQGIRFHTDAHSLKVAYLAAQPAAAITLLWPGTGRQLSGQGITVRETRTEEESAYRNRSRYLQILAWLNTASSAHLPAAERASLWAEFDAAHPEGTLTAPGTWVGYRLQPLRVSFWQGRPDRAGIRVEYSRVAVDSAQWRVELLPG